MHAEPSNKAIIIQNIVRTQDFDARLMLIPFLQGLHELHSEPTNKAIIIQNIERTQELIYIVANQSIIETRIRSRIFRVETSGLYS